MAVLLLFSILSVFVATSSANLEPPADTVPVQDAMGGKDYVVVVMDYFNLTETDEVNCHQAAEHKDPEKQIGAGWCNLVVESRLCFLDEKSMKVSDRDDQCISFKGVRVWRGNTVREGAFSGRAYEKLSCLSWALGEDFKLFSGQTQDADLAAAYPKNAAVDRPGIGCIAWATTELIDSETKSKIDRGYFQLAAKFSQFTGQAATPLTDLLPMASQGFHLAPTRLHLAFYNGSPCKANTCTRLEFRFGVFTESGQGLPRANAAILKPRVKVYDER